MDIVIVGAGITGLAAGISLRRCGHRVTILERSSLNDEIGAAIHVPPNVSRFLLKWGFDPTRARFVTSTGVYFMSHETMEEQSFFEWPSAVDSLRAPLYYAHRVDLHDGLKDLAIDVDGAGEPIKIYLKSEVIDYKPDIPSVTLKDGTTVNADLLIAADGLHSRAVEAVSGRSNSPRPASHANCCYRFLIPRTDLDVDPKTSFFVNGPYRLHAKAFTDVRNQRRLISYPCRNYQVINFAAICTDLNLLANKEDWHAPADKGKLLEAFSGYHPSLIAVLSKAKEVKRWPLLYRPPLSTWHRGKMVLAGDAAHPMLPHLGQGGAQGIEDGLALGLVFHGAAHPSQIEERLCIFEKIRRNRASFIQVLSNVGIDEEKTASVAEYLEGRPTPKSPSDIIKMLLEHDVVKQTIRYMTELDPAFKLPEGFFPRGPDFQE